MRLGRIIFFGLPLLAAPLWAASFDHSAYDAILRKYVNDEGWVDYEMIRRNARKDLDGYLARLAEASLEGWRYEEKLAFWINAYNAHMIENILNHPEMKKVSENFVLFDIPFKVAGGNYTLNDIESRIRKFDPRIHFALVCAAVSCPKLQNFAYTADNLEATLQAAAVRFAYLSKHVAIVKGRLRLSSLLKWYKDDFTDVGGVPLYLSRLLKLTHRPDVGAIEELLKTQFDKADYEYDWTVNDIRNAKKAAPTS